jgi:hypothetical protein
MNSLRDNKDVIFKIKNQVENLDSSLFEHIVINVSPISPAVSIVMTSSNRSKQTYFTLDTFKNSSCKNIHVVIVDDSTDDPIQKNILEKYPFNIDLIIINRTNKKWHNPLVNYNIGFKFVKGANVIIQNAEVCHVGDVINFVNEYTLDNNYYVFDVNATNSFVSNEQIYKMDTSTIDIYNNPELFDTWYQSRTKNRFFHFLTGMRRNTFDLICNFSYDCTMGTMFDDNDFVLKILSKNINIVNIFHDTNKIGGIHLFHQLAINSWDKQKENNDVIFINKKYIFDTINYYVDVTESYESFDSEYEKINIDLQCYQAFFINYINISI